MILAIDNGCSGALAVLWDKGRAELYPLADYSKKDRIGSKGITRLDYPKFKDLLSVIFKGSAVNAESIFCYIEKPATNVKFSTQSIASAARFDEAEKIALEEAGIGYEMVSSHNWQKKMLPGIKTRPELKKASLMKGQQMFPQLAKAIAKQKDADALLMAKYYMREGVK